jgi:Protein of unknown function (DUF2612).
MITSIDYQAETKALVTSIFKDSPIFLGLLESIVAAYEDQQNDFIWYGEHLLDIDSAENSQLDLIGRIVGQSRILVSFNTEPYFGFEGAYQAETFGTAIDPNVGGLWNSYGYYNAATSRLLTDEEYKRIIKARIIKNNTNCKTNDLIEVINLLAGNSSATVTVQTHGLIQIIVDDPIGMVSYFIDKIGTLDDILPIAVGVRVEMIEGTT